MRLGDFSASLFVDDSPLDEYDIVADEGRREITCYVPSQAGKKFTVRWADWTWEQGMDSAGFVSVDGLRCSGKVTKMLNRGTVQRTGFDVDERTVRDFMFSDIKSTDDDAQLHALGHEKLGEISLEIWRGKVMGTAAPRSYDEKPNDNCVVHERVKKAMVHCVGFAEERKLSGPTRRSRFCFLGKHPVSRFVFKYRPLAVLQAQGISQTPVAQRPCTDASIEFRPNKRVSVRIRALEPAVAELQKGQSSQTLPVKRTLDERPDERPAKRIKLKLPSQTNVGSCPRSLRFLYRKDFRVKGHTMKRK
ncbi:hypothetical protein CONPUDRAFT_135869 [Coniophora puteana RWD-64-598 SS2]|uniref:DUF7918 domain-containing protein n=1 Tax=Coniophora puteana (strain RWD-64-598) TaxID=741705 RepID=A0A5M3MZ44_CONPW|nr:uncharacterized protein CONPUDRAFT_135869 [Coniophora puteana RWD-64-598 SS2]EIW84418.1 hypothetical protein CONPUDRAFT_135869 [Coniophora puteana RWD-64-598 SS2]